MKTQAGTLAVLFILLLPCVVFARKLKPEVECAMAYGAEAKICLKVCDNAGAPVTNASVRAVFDMLPKPHSVYGKTDTNGVCIVKGKTNGNKVEFLVCKDGYYGSSKAISYIQMWNEHDVKDGQWQPYGAEMQLLLRQMKSPLRLISERILEYRHTDRIGAWLGFDVKKNDFVKPYGNGETNDFLVFLDWDGERFPNCQRIGFKIKFAEEHSGYYEVPIESGSEMTTPYNAIPDMRYVREAEFYDVYDGKRIRQTFDKSKCWVVRSRCKSDGKGRLIAANYAVVRFVGMSGSCDGKAGFCFLSAFNPTPNDTNLEDIEIAKLSRHFIRQCEPPMNSMLEKGASK